MTVSLTALASENLNPGLKSLLEDVLRGYIRVPRFQRPFVWRDEQRLELLRSIRDNMPIGSLLVWRTAQFKLASFPSVGPHVLPPVADNPPTTGWQYILDGHQRVSTLLGLLLRSDSSSVAKESFDDDAIDWDIQYDLMEEDFVFAKKIKKSKKETRPLLPLSNLFDGRRVNKFLRDFRSEKKGWTDADMEIWEERADQLSYRFQQCRVPVVIIVTDELELAAKTFQRINSLGTSMSEAHLVAALTWKENFDLRDRLDRLRETFPLGWREIDESIFLQVCKGISGLDMTKAVQSDLVEKLNNSQDLLDRAGRCLGQAVEFLSGKLFISNRELLPYTLQLVLMAVEWDYSIEKGIPVPETEFIRWFWRTGWAETFGSASYRQIRAECATLRDRSDATWVRERDLPHRFDFRSARVPLFVLRLALKKDNYNVYGKRVDNKKLLARHGRSALVQLFNTPPKASSFLKSLLQGVGNRFFIDPMTESVFRERLQEGPDLPSEVLAAHFVDATTLKVLRQKNLENFLFRRAQVMNQFDLEEWAAERESLYY